MEKLIGVHRGLGLFEGAVTIAEGTSHDSPADPE